MGGEAAVAGTDGCRPHEVRLLADVQPPGLLRIAEGKIQGQRDVRHKAAGAATLALVLSGRLRCPGPASVTQQQQIRCGQEGTQSCPPAIHIAEHQLQTARQGCPVLPREYPRKGAQRIPAEARGQAPPAGAEARAGRQRRWIRSAAMALSMVATPSLPGTITPDSMPPEQLDELLALLTTQQAAQILDVLELREQRRQVRRRALDGLSELGQELQAVCSTPRS